MTRDRSLLRLAALHLTRDIEAGRYSACDLRTQLATQRLARFLFEMAEDAPVRTAPPVRAVPWVERAEYKADGGV